MVDTKNLQNVCDFLQTHKNDIIKAYDAVGVGVGKMQHTDDDYVIVVYLKKNDQVPAKTIFLDNVRLKFEVTGEFSLHAK